MISIALNVLLICLVAYLVWFGLNFRGRLIDRIAERKISLYEALNENRGKIVFFGDSLTEGGIWDELFPGAEVLNRGIGGNATGHLLERIGAIYGLAPRKLFIMIGVNDLNRKVRKDVTLSNYQSLFDGIDQNLPDTKVYIQSILPVSNNHLAAKNKEIRYLNEVLKEHANRRGYCYIDLYPHFLDSENLLEKDLSNDGIHLMAPGYFLWRDLVSGYVFEQV